MTLTAEDIVNKRFQSTKFREGYDQDEVDDFLDEVVVEMRRVIAENDELTQKLAASEARIAELQRSGGSASSVGVSPLPTSGGDVVEAENANNLLQLARRLHEEHVREGIQKRDELIAEGHAQAARIVQEAETEHSQVKQRLQAERASIQAGVEELKNFEREYRNSLKAFINQQIQGLETTSQPATAPEGA
jgi:DivIVA domain-containing protein